MQELPLHPALVHIPLGLAFVLPLLQVALFWSIRRGWLPARSWVLALLLQIFLVGGAIAGLQTGEIEEHKAEKYVSHDVLEQHEENAKLFLAAAVAAFLLGGVPLVLRSAGAVLTSQIVAILASLLVLFLGVRTGHSGGELVYVHGAVQVPISLQAQEPEH